MGEVEGRKEVRDMNCDALNPLNDFGYCWDAKGVMMLFEHYLRGGAKPQTSCISAPKQKVEIDLSHIGTGIVREDLLKMTKLQMALDSAKAQVEALRAENEKLKAENEDKAKENNRLYLQLGTERQVTEIWRKLVEISGS